MKTAVRAVAIGLLAACALIGFAAAFALSVATRAEAGTAQTPPPTTTTPPPTEPPPTQPPPPPPPPPSQRGTMASGVTVAGTPVEGLTPYEAAALVRARFGRPLVLDLGTGRKARVMPAELGARPNVKKAVGRARFARPYMNVPLDVTVPRARVQRYVERLGRDLDRPAVDARMVYSRTMVRAVPAKEGRRLQRLQGTRDIRFALKTHVRGPVALGYATVVPKVTEEELGPAIVILRESKKLRYFENAKLVRTFGIATGQASFPTPLGSYEIVTLQRNPWWYPPPSDWAAGKDPVPPGPGNPLGTRWMGISAPYVGIHGTPDAASIGYSASHGCIRMRISDAEWLFERMKIGAPVFIVPR